jgi:hypothetical protein
MMIAISQKPTFVTMTASAQKATIQTLMLVRLPSALCNDMEQGSQHLQPALVLPVNVILPPPQAGNLQGRTRTLHERLCAQPAERL